MPDVITMGEALIDFVPQQVDCPLREVTDFHRAPGGAPANVAVGLSRLDVKAGFMGKVGDDAFGHFLEKTLEENGVDTSEMVSSDEAMTTLAFVSLRSDGERDFAFYRKPGADMMYRSEEVDFSYVDDAHVFHFGSISLIKGPAQTTTMDLIDYAREQGILISFDPNIRPPLWDSLEQAVTKIKGVIPLAGVIKLNEEELELLTDADIEIRDDRLTAAGREVLARAAGDIYQQGPELVIVTLGKRGCFYYNGEISGYVPGYKCEAIDTTGAGDGFVAGVLSKLSKDRLKDRLPGLHQLKEIDKDEIEDMLAFANKVGAMSTTKNGGIPSLPQLEEVETETMEIYKD